MKTDIHRALWRKGARANVWAVVDAARDRRVYQSLVNSFLNYSCLYSGRLPEEIERVAPYLVQLDPEDKFTDFLTSEWGGSLGVFIRCDTSMKELRRHLRRFLIVRDTGGRRLLFRYYDPRVLRVYLPTCDSMEMKTVFGPIEAYWTESADASRLIEFQFDGRKLVRDEHPIGEGTQSGKAAASGLSPEIVCPQPALVIQKGTAAPRRTPLLLQAAGLGAKLQRSSDAIRLYRSATAGKELSFPNGALDLPPAGLDPDVTLYAEGAAPGEASLTLTLHKGGSVTRRFPIVELALQTGLAGDAQYQRGVAVGTTAGTRRRLIVPKGKYGGRLALRASPALKIFRGVDAASATPFASGDSFEAPEVFWLEAAKPSREAGDLSVQLTLDGDTAAADWTAATAAVVSPISGAPEVLLAGSSGPIRLSASATPEWAEILWRGASGGELAPSDPGPHTVTAALEPEGWGGPSSSVQVDVVQAVLGPHQCAVDARAAACGPEPGTRRFALHSGKSPAIHLSAEIALRGPAGAVDSIRAAWVNNIVSDNTGARYKGGKVVSRVVEAADGPVLDAQPPGFEMSGNAAGGDPLTVTAHAAPAAVFDSQAPAAIEQIWSYLECRSHLVLWSIHAPEQRAVLLTAGWSFTGDYVCTPQKAVRATVKARVAGTGNTPYAEAVPAAKAGVVLQPRASS